MNDKSNGTFWHLKLVEDAIKNCRIMPIAHLLVRGFFGIFCIGREYVITYQV